MNYRTILTLLLILCLYGLPRAQDAFHYTLHDFTQIGLNPALAGSFEGTARVGGIFREQDFGLTIGQYRNPLVYIDVPVIRGFKPSHWVALGMYYLYDQQRYDEVDLITSRIFGGIAYHVPLDKNMRHVLSLGVQSGSGNTYFSSPDITTWSEFGPNPHEDPAEAALPIKNPSQGTGSSPTGRTNWVGGVHLKSMLGAQNQLSVGFSMANIGRVSNSIAGQGSFSTAPLRFIVHGSYMTPIADRITLEPRLFFQYQQPSWDMSVQALAKFQVNPEKENVFGGGLGYNLQNGLQFLLTADFGNLKAGYSFDLNLTDKTSVSSPAAAFELAVAYVLKIYKKPNPDPVLVCPRL